MKNTKEFTKFTELEKQVIRAWCNEIKFSDETFEDDMHSAVTYWAIETYEIAEATKIPLKILRGVLSSLIKKKVFSEGEISGDTWTSPDKPAFFFGQYFCKDNYEGNQVDDCNMAKVYDAIK